MTSTVAQFKNVFLSPKNTDFLMQTITDKASKIYNKIITIDTVGLEQLQKFIFDTHFADINDELNATGPLMQNLQKTLKSLNKLTVSHMMNLIHQQLTFNTPQAPPQSQVPPPTPPSPTPQQVPPQMPRQVPPQMPDQVSPQMPDQVPPQMPYQVPTQNQSFTPQQVQLEQQIEYCHFFSQDALIKDGTYHFKVALPKTPVKSIAFQNFVLTCDWFNVTEFNNKMTLTESESQPINISLPVGFYNCTELTQQLQNTLNDVSPNKLSYTVGIMDHNNKVKISCKTRDGAIPVMFNLGFCDKHLQFNNFSINELLGFKKKDYCNNNCYIGEESVARNAYNEIYCKVLVNGSNVQRIKSSINDFSYFTYIQPDYDSKVVCTNNSEEFVFEQEIEIQNISFQFWNTRNYSITVPFAFDTVVQFCL